MTNLGYVDCRCPICNLTTRVYINPDTDDYTTQLHASVLPHLVAFERHLLTHQPETVAA